MRLLQIMRLIRCIIPYNERCFSTKSCAALEEI